MTPEASTITMSQAKPFMPTSSPCSRIRPLPRLTDVIRTVRPVAAPLISRSATSTLTTGGRLTVCALPRTQMDGSSHTITVWMAHCMGADPSTGAAALVDGTTANRIARAPMALIGASLRGLVEGDPCRWRRSSRAPSPRRPRPPPASSRWRPASSRSHRPPGPKRSLRRRARDFPSRRLRPSSSSCVSPCRLFPAATERPVEAISRARSPATRGILAVACRSPWWPAAGRRSGQWPWSRRAARRAIGVQAMLQVLRDVRSDGREANDEAGSVGRRRLNDLRIKLSRTGTRLDLGDPDLHVAEQRHWRGRPDLGVLLGETHDTSVHHVAPHVLVREDGIANRNRNGQRNHSRRRRMQEQRVGSTDPCHFPHAERLPGPLRLDLQLTTHADQRGDLLSESL